MPQAESVASFPKVDYDYGNRSSIQVIRILPNVDPSNLDPFASLAHDTTEKPYFTESELKDKVTELTDNYRVIGDPKSTEKSPKQFGITILNLDLARQGVPAKLTFSTAGSSLFNKKGVPEDKAVPNNEKNGLELAYKALKYSTPVIYIESPGSGNSSDLDEEEYAEAMQNGKLIHETYAPNGFIKNYEAFDTIQAIVRALQSEGIATPTGVPINHITANASATLFSTAFKAALPKGTVEKSFLYNPTNISDRNALMLGVLTLKEIMTQGKYDKHSRDPLKMTDERVHMAREVMGSVKKSKIALARSSTHNPRKLSRQQKIFRRGNENGQSAAVHAVAAEMQHPDSSQVYVFPEFAAQYKNSKDIYRFIELTRQLGGKVMELQPIQGLMVPLGQYGHSHFPSLHLDLESYAFNQ